MEPDGQGGRGREMGSELGTAGEALDSEQGMEEIDLVFYNVPPSDSCRGPLWKLRDQSRPTAASGGALMNGWR